MPLTDIMYMSQVPDIMTMATPKACTKDTHQNITAIRQLEAGLFIPRYVKHNLHLLMEHKILILIVPSCCIFVINGFACVLILTTFYAHVLFF